MTKFGNTLAIVLLCLSCSPALAAARGGKIDSIHDLPKRWTGTAGDLLQTGPATFDLSRVIQVVRSPNGDIPGTVVYEVQATLQMGTRSLPVHKMTLVTFSDLPNHAEIWLSFDDELARAMQLLVSYDEASNRFTMSDPFVNGMRRISMSGDAPSR